MSLGDNPIIRPSDSAGSSLDRSTRQSVVAVVATRPNTVLQDIERAMLLAGVDQHLSTDLSTLLKINISWQHWYPACSTSPWQLEGTIQALQKLGHQHLIAAHNGTVVVDSFEGEVNNKQKVVQDRYQLPTVHLDTPPNQWVDYKPKAQMLVLDDIFPEGIQIPETFAGKNIVHLPTPSADHEDPCLHHHDRSDEERLWRTIASQAALDPLGDPRDPG